MVKKARSFEGFEILFHSLKMTAKMAKYLFVSGVVAYILLTGCIFYFKTPPQVRPTLLLWLEAEIKAFSNPILLPLESWFPIIERHYDPTVNTVPPERVVENIRPYWIARIKNLGSVLKYFPVFLLVYFAVALAFFRQKAQRELYEIKLRRGFQVIEPKELTRRLKKSARQKKFGYLQLTNKVKLPREHETRHIFVVGMTGVGKSQFLKAMIDQVRKQGKGIIFDIKGEYLSAFFDSKRDIIFNPLDARCVGWDFFSDLANEYEVYDFARSFVPSASGQGNEAYFADAARDVFASVLRVLLKQGGATYEDMCRILFGSVTEVAAFLKEHRHLGGDIGLSHIAKTDSNQALGVHSTMIRYLRTLDILRGLGQKFSLRKWYTSDEPGFLFLPVPEGYSDLLAPIFTALVGVLMKHGLSLPDDLNRRRYFFIDELGALYGIPKLVDVLTLGRSKGISLWLGIQDFGRMKERYGTNLTETIFNNTLTKLVFRVDAPETAEHLSRALGEGEVEDRKKTYSLGVMDHRDGLSYTRDDHIKRLFLPSQIQSLEDLYCIIKVANHPPAVDQIRFRKWPAEQPSFIPREIPERMPPRDEKIQEEPEQERQPTQPATQEDRANAKKTPPELGY